MVLPQFYAIFNGFDHGSSSKLANSETELIRWFSHKLLAHSEMIWCVIEEAEWEDCQTFSMLCVEESGAEAERIVFKNIVLHWDVCKLICFTFDLGLVIA